MDFSGGFTETERRGLMGDDNNTREKRIDVGKYLTLCGLWKSHHTGVSVIFMRGRVSFV